MKNIKTFESFGISDDVLALSKFIKNRMKSSDLMDKFEFRVNLKDGYPSLSKYYDEVLVSYDPTYPNSSVSSIYKKDRVALLKLSNSSLKTITHEVNHLYITRPSKDTAVSSLLTVKNKGKKIDKEDLLTLTEILYTTSGEEINSILCEVYTDLVLIGTTKDTFKNNLMFSERYRYFKALKKISSDEINRIFEGERGRRIAFLWKECERKAKDILPENFYDEFKSSEDRLSRFYRFMYDSFPKISTSLFNSTYMESEEYTQSLKNKFLKKIEKNTDTFIKKCHKLWSIFGDQPILKGDDLKNSVSDIDIKKVIRSLKDLFGDVFTKEQELEVYKSFGY